MARLLCCLWIALFAIASRAAPLPVSEVAAGVFVHQGVHEEFGDGYHGDIANIGFVIGDACAPRCRYAT